MSEEELKARIAELEATLDVLYLKLFTEIDDSQIHHKFAEKLMGAIEDVYRRETPPPHSERSQVNK